MPIGTCVARAFCVVVTVGVVGACDPAWAGETDPHGLLLERLSKGQLRVWRAIEGLGEGGIEGEDVAEM